MSLSLEQKIQETGSVVEVLRSNNGQAITGPKTGAEVTNWHDEQLSWRNTCALMDLSHHMTDITLKGPDAMKLVSYLGVNSWKNFKPGRAKQFVAVNYDGYIIGDAIAEYLDDGSIRLAGNEPIPNWVKFHCETGNYDVEYKWDEPTSRNPAGHPENYRFQLTGPHAYDILEKACGGPVEEVKFFRTKTMTVAGVSTIAMGHGMTRAPGLELIGPWSEQHIIRGALMEAGIEFGMCSVGSRAPASGTLESGWIPSPIPAIFTGEEMKAFREWLPADGPLATGSLGGSLTHNDISNYYMRPEDLNYMRLVKFDHDFIGREALEAIADKQSRRKVTLEWNIDDVFAVKASQFGDGVPGKWMELPILTYSTWAFDKVTKDGKTVGFSTFAGYTTNERKMLSLACISTDIEHGDEVVVTWGEEDGGAGSAGIETHKQFDIRAKVCRVPYSDVYHK